MDNLVAQLQNELNESFKESLKQNMSSFEKIARIQSRNLEYQMGRQTSLLTDLAQNIERHFPGTQTHTLLNHPDLQAVWKEMVCTPFGVGHHWANLLLDPDIKFQNLRHSVKAKKFILTFRDYYHTQLYFLPTGGRGVTDPAAISAEQVNDHTPAQDEWALAYINVSNLHPIIEAIDADFSGFINIKEANSFAFRGDCPPNWSLLQWFAYWAAGQAVSLKRYKDRILDLVQWIFDAYLLVLPCNSTCVGDYLDSEAFSALDLLLRATQPPTKDTHDAKLESLVECYEELSAQRMASGLKDLRYNLLSLEKVILVGGSERVETFIFPLVYLLLQHHLEVIESGSQLCLSPFRLQAASDTLVEVITALHFRARELDGVFQQRLRNIEAQFKTFSFGMLEPFRTHLGPEYQLCDNIFSEELLFAEGDSENDEDGEWNVEDTDPGSTSQLGGDEPRYLMTEDSVELTLQMVMWKLWSEPDIPMAMETTPLLGVPFAIADTGLQLVLQTEDGNGDEDGSDRDEDGDKGGDEDEDGQNSDVLTSRTLDSDLQGARPDYPGTFGGSSHGISASRSLSVEGLGEMIYGEWSGCLYSSRNGSNSPLYAVVITFTREEQPGANEVTAVMESFLGSVELRGDIHIEVGKEEDGGWTDEEGRIGTGRTVTEDLNGPAKLEQDKATYASANKAAPSIVLELESNPLSPELGYYFQLTSVGVGDSLRWKGEWCYKGGGKRNGLGLCEVWHVPHGGLPFSISDPSLREDTAGPPSSKREASPVSTGGSNIHSVARARWSVTINAVLRQVRWRMGSNIFLAAKTMNRYVLKLAQISILQSDTDMAQHDELLKIWSRVNPRVAGLWTCAAATGRFLASRLPSAGHSDFLVRCDYCRGDIFPVLHLCITCMAPSMNNQIDICERCVDRHEDISTEEFEHKPSHTLLKMRRRILKMEVAARINDARHLARTVKDGSSFPSGSELAPENRRCLHCEQDVSLPYWSCIDCDGYQFICKACEEGNKHPDTHFLLRIVDYTEETTDKPEGHHQRTHAIVEEGVNQVKSRVELLERKVDDKLGGLEERIGSLEARMGNHMEDICVQVDRIGRKVTSSSSIPSTPATPPSAATIAVSPAPSGYLKALPAVESVDEVAALSHRMDKLEAMVARIFEAVVPIDRTPSSHD